MLTCGTINLVNNCPYIACELMSLDMLKTEPQMSKTLYASEWNVIGKCLHFVYRRFNVGCRN